MKRRDAASSSEEKSGKPEIPPLELEEQIRLRAHQIYEERGMVDGSPLDDWLQAESELREQGEAGALKKTG